MSENAFTRMQAIAAVLIRNEGIADNSSFIVFDTDTLTACAVKNVTDGQFNITGEWSFPPEKDFYTLASERFFGTSDKAADIFGLCGGAYTSLVQFLKLKLNESKNAVLDESAGITCRGLLDLYKENFEQPLRTALGEAIKANPSVNIHPVGKLAAFYPALHTVKTMLCAMPFAPTVPFLVESKEYYCDTLAFEAAGRAILEEAQQKKRSVKHNVFLTIKKLTADGITDEYRLMAPEGASYTDFSAPVYSEPFFAHKNDSLRLLSGGSCHSVTIPAEAFPENTDTDVISVALLYEGDGLSLSIRSTAGSVSAQLDEKIYS